MKHFLITQFNLKGVAKQTTEKEWLEWNEYRFKFFEDYTLKSLLNQSEKNFTWLIFFDNDTPKSCFNYISKWSKYDFLKPILVNGIKEFDKSYAQIVLDMSENTEWVITSRIDNDDVFHYSSIQSIQECFIKKDKQLLSLASGYVLNMESLKLAHYYYFKSPFLSIIERNNKGSFVGIYKYSHTYWPTIPLNFSKMIKGKYANLDENLPIYLLDKPYWIQLIHNNLQNTFYRGMPVVKSKNLKEFSIDINTNKLSIFSIFKFYNYYLWKRYVWAIIYKIIYKTTL